MTAVEELCLLKPALSSSVKNLDFCDSLSDCGGGGPSHLQMLQISGLPSDKVSDSRKTRNSAERDNKQLLESICFDSECVNVFIVLIGCNTSQLCAETV